VSLVRLSPERLGGNEGRFLISSSLPAAGILLPEMLPADPLRDILADVEDVGAPTGAIDRLGGGKVGGISFLIDTIDDLRESAVPSTVTGDPGLLKILGFFGTGGAGLRCIEDWMERTESGVAERVAGGELRSSMVGRLGGSCGVDSEGLDGGGNT